MRHNPLKTILLMSILFLPHNSWASEDKILTMDEFIRLATERDSEFESILIDKLTLQYRKDIELPAKDLILDVRTQYSFLLDADREEPEGSISLSKLFPFTGTEIETEYSTSSSFTARDNSSSFSATVTQPLLENAFGKTTRLQDKIIGLEIEVAHHQIVEAYEDYLATLIVAYLDWYAAYENLNIGMASYNENLKLVDNIKERQGSNIALPIDVHKIEIQALTRKEDLVERRQTYKTTSNFIIKALRLEPPIRYRPQRPDIYDTLNIAFQKDFENFSKKSRTYDILRLLEKRSNLDVDKNANELLPSLSLLFGYEVSGKERRIKEENALAFAAFELEWPFTDQKERAELETAKITLDQTRLSTQNTHYRLYTNILNLTHEIERERELLQISLEKIKLATDILEDETENYSYGKVTLNDYIQAVNTLDTNRFSRIRRDVAIQKFVVEYLRLTDRLISKNKISMQGNHDL